MIQLSRFEQHTYVIDNGAEKPIIIEEVVGYLTLKQPGGNSWVRRISFYKEDLDAYEGEPVTEVLNYITTTVSNALELMGRDVCEKQGE